MNSVIERKIRSNHGSVKDRKAEVVEQVKLDAGQIAVGEERFRVLLDEREIEAIEQIIGAVATTHAGNDGAVWIGECRVKICEALFRSTGKKERPAFLSICAEAGSEAECAQALKTAVYPLGLCERGGRKNADASSFWD